MTWDETVTKMKSQIGKRIRVTHPNGYQRTGKVSMVKIGDDFYVALNGHLAGGEYDGAVSVEAMGANRRYHPVN